MSVAVWRIQYYMKIWDLSDVWEYFENFQKKRG